MRKKRRRMKKLDHDIPLFGMAILVGFALAKAGVKVTKLPNHEEKEGNNDK